MSTLMQRYTFCENHNRRECYHECVPVTLESANNAAGVFKTEVFTLTEPNPVSDHLMARVAQVIARTQHIPVESVTLDKTFEELKIDSLDGINMLFEVESEFNVEIPDAAVQSIRSVREMVNGIEVLLTAQASRLAAPPAAVMSEDL